MALPPYFWLVLLVLVALGVAIWWARTQQLDAQRRSMRAFYSLNEQIFAAPSPAEIAERLAETLPSILQATTVRLYLWDRRTASLESVPTAADPAPVAFPLEGSVRRAGGGSGKVFSDADADQHPGRAAQSSGECGMEIGYVAVGYICSAAGAAGCVGRDRSGQHAAAGVISRRRSRRRCIIWRIRWRRL